MLPLFFVLMPAPTSKKKRSEIESHSLFQWSSQSQKQSQNQLLSQSQSQPASPITTATAIRNRNVGRGNPRIAADHHAIPRIHLLQQRHLLQIEQLPIRSASCHFRSRPFYDASTAFGCTPAI